MPAVAVVGGGVAGLAAARQLAGGGVRVVVFDKGRGPAGRAATRREQPYAFDHGAQYFTVRDPRFARVVERSRIEEVAAPWGGRLVTLGERGSQPLPARERFVGVPSMSALARWLGNGVVVEPRVRVTGLAKRGARWRLTDQDGQDFGPYDRVVLAVPPADALRLLDSGSPLRERVSAARMRPCWAVMLGLDRRYDVDLDGAYLEEGALSWVARDSSKPGRPAGEAWVLHASPGWSRSHPHDAPHEVAAILTRELENRMGVRLPRAVVQEAHLWRHAHAAEPLVERALVDAEGGLAVCGDWCGGSRVESAWLSGMEAAERVLALLGLTGQ